jgi:23S rRNA (adenine2503-C2)-methyltransferase
VQVPKNFREELVAAGVITGRSRAHNSIVAIDGTRKFLRQLADGHVVEAVGIPADDYGKPRLTACVSSQVLH